MEETTKKKKGSLYSKESTDQRASGSWEQRKQETGREKTGENKEKRKTRGGKGLSTLLFYRICWISYWAAYQRRKEERLETTKLLED